MEHIDFSLVDWSRAQFALTALYHWLFVPLTLGLSFIIAFMETLYFRTGNPEWKRITKFWMTLFGVNFAIGVLIRVRLFDSILGRNNAILSVLTITDTVRWGIKFVIRQARGIKI